MEAVMKSNDTLTAWIEEAVDKGARTAEEIHRAVADLPFEVLERNGLFVKTVADLRSIQDRSIGAIYDVVRGVNHEVGTLASSLIERRGEPSEDSRAAS
jgi:hypothetical protein